MGHPKFKVLLKELEANHEKKSASYATKSQPFKNYDTAAKFMGCMPEQYVLGRAAEKFERLQQIPIDGENRVETLKDIAALCLIAAVMLEE